MLTADQIDKSNFRMAPEVSYEPVYFAECLTENGREGYAVLYFNNKPSFILEVEPVEYQKADKIRELVAELAPLAYGSRTLSDREVDYLEDNCIHPGGKWVLATVPVLIPERSPAGGDPLGQGAYKSHQKRLVWVPDIKGCTPVHPDDVITV